MNCEQVQELLSPYADGMLEQGEMNQISRHLKNCSHCLEEYQQLRALITALKSLNEVDLPEGFHDRLHDRLVHDCLVNETTRRRGNPVVNKRTLIPSWLPVGAVAAVLMVLFLGLSPGGQLVVDAPTVEMAPSRHIAVTHEQQPKRADTGNIQKNNADIQDRQGAANVEVKSEPASPSGGAASGYQGESGSVDDDKLASNSSTEMGNSVFSGGFRTDSGGRGKGEDRSSEEMFKASGLVPFKLPPEEQDPASAAELSDSGAGQAPAFIQMEVDSLEDAFTRLIDIVKSLDGDINAPPNEPVASSLKGNATSATYSVSIPCSAVNAFIDDVSDLGVVVKENVKVGFGSEKRCGDSVAALEQRKQVLFQLLSHTSQVEKIREVQQEISAIDQKLAKLKADPGSQQNILEIRIIVEEKGN